MPPDSRSTVEPVPVAVEHLSRWYGNVVAVNDVTFSVGPGLTALLGPNGAGKTTLLHLLAGLLAPSAGTVRIDGRSPWRHPELFRQVGLVAEREGLPTYLTGRAFLELVATLHGLRQPPRAAAAGLALLGLQAVGDRAIAGYSQGMRQRLKLAAALIHDPPILLLDEPFNGLDPRQRLQMAGLLREMAAAGRVILLSSHILEEVERVADRILVMIAGRLAAAGDVRAIRRLMTDRPRTVRVRSSDDRRLGAILLAEGLVDGTDLTDGSLVLRVRDGVRFGRGLAPLARREGIRLLAVEPADEALDQVFAYLVEGARRP
jgi:ABC-2 type transport system ATP-binding protein